MVFYSVYSLLVVDELRIACCIFLPTGDGYLLEGIFVCGEPKLLKCLKCSPQKYWYMYEIAEVCAITSEILGHV